MVDDARAAGGPRRARAKAWESTTASVEDLVKDLKIKSLEEIYLFCVPIKESEIIDFSKQQSLKMVLKILPVQKQTQAGQRTRFKASFVVGEDNSDAGLGIKCHLPTSWPSFPLSLCEEFTGETSGKPHTVPCKLTDLCGAVLVRHIPYPKSTGIVSAPVLKELLLTTRIDDCSTSVQGCTATLGNFTDIIFDATSKT